MKMATWTTQPNAVKGETILQVFFISFARLFVCTGMCYVSAYAFVCCIVVFALTSIYSFTHSIFVYTHTHTHTQTHTHTNTHTNTHKHSQTTSFVADANRVERALDPSARNAEAAIQRGLG